MRKTKLTIFLAIISFALFGGAGVASADSDLFPPYENAPALTSYVSGGVFKHTYYISPTGDDATGDGSIGNPWLSFNGMTSGGSGVPVVAGDIVYARGGTYPTHLKTAWKEAYYALKRSGTASDYIVITAYPGETPVFDGADGWPSFSIHGNYVVIDGLTFVGGSSSGSTNNGGNFYFQNADYGVVQNNTFLGGCGDGQGDQVTGVCVGLDDNVDHIIVRNNYFGPSTGSHAVKNYTSDSIVNNVQIMYNRFYNNTTAFGVIGIKGTINTWEISYNRFENSKAAITFGTTYAQGIHAGIKVHHNAFDGVFRKVIERLGSPSGDLREIEFHNNIILNNSSDTETNSERGFLMLRCTENGCMNTGVQAMGEFYNNVLYDSVDLINPQTTSQFVNYPNYWNYNAYPSTATMATAENQNSLSASSWDGSSVIAANHGIIRTGVAGNRFYSIPDTSPFRNSGRYGDAIGGFVWSTTLPDTTPPSAPQGLVVN